MQLEDCSYKYMYYSYWYGFNFRYINTLMGCKRDIISKVKENVLKLLSDGKRTLEISKKVEKSDWKTNL